MAPNARKILGTAIFLFLSPRIASAACHVVKPGGSGFRTGKDWNSAYSDLPRSLVRGDVYYAAAGTYGRHAFNDRDDGNKTIEVRAVTSTDHCSDTGWSNSFVGESIFTCATSGCGSVFGFATDYYVINGQYRSTATGQPGMDWKAGYGFKIDNSNARACGSDIGGGSSSPSFVHDITLEYMEINGSHPQNDSCHEDGVGFAGGSYNLTFQYLYNHDVGNNNFNLTGSHGHDGGGSGYGPGTNILVQYSYWSYDYSSPAVHGQACQCSEGLKNLTIRYNYIADMVGTAYIATPSAAGYNTGNQNNGPWYIYGNIFYADDPKHCAVGDGVLAVFDATFTDNIYFLNNTIANLGGNFCTGQLNTGFGFGLTYNTPLKGLYVENNLWWNSDPITIMRKDTTSWNGATMVSTNWSYNAYVRDPNSQAKDPDVHKQVSLATPFANSSIFNYELAVHTLNGSSTHALVPGNDVDLKGATRGVNGTWDRGAFQMPAPAQAPKPKSKAR